MGDLERLRDLLLAEERESLARADRRIVELERTRNELPAQLPGLVRAAPAQAMADALATPVASALGNAVRHNSSSIVDALFPVIGPLIRKAIAEALRGLMSDLNSVLEQSFTPRGLKWRLEAWRGGVPYAQVVLKYTLRYRIDHVFLIERDSGLVLHRASSPGVADLDADAIAGMLTAIGQFVRDSVGREQGDSLEEARVGEYLLWLVDGPRASIACFIRGVPPDALRVLLEQRLEDIHARLGSAEPVEPGSLVHASLDPGELVRITSESTGRPASSSRWPLLILLLAGLAGLGAYVARQERWQQRVDGVHAALAAHPGFVLTRLEEKPWRSLTVHGLLDADAEALPPLLAGIDLGGVGAQWQLDSYVSGDDGVVLRRAQRLLDAPAGVTLDVRDGRLAVAGRAARAWIDVARARADWVPGVRSVAFDVGNEADPASLARAELDRIARDIERIHVLFVHDVEPVAAADESLDQMVAAVTRAAELAATAGIPLRIAAGGFNDQSGSGELNAMLRAARARWLVEALAARGVPARLLRDADAQEDPSAATMRVRGARVRLVQESTAP